MHTLVRYINVLVNFQTRNKLIKLILTVQCKVVSVSASRQVMVAK